MTAAAGLLLALVCLAIVGAGLGLAVATWRPSAAPTALFIAGVGVGATALVATAVHQLATVLP
ncbi:hypothetical protein [Streptomyces sp. NPDC002952]|uniref:hypothetical protein n=1 Tax=Streptomyces sp. NPDC002952 TaxID=3364673 RepID=UPI003676B954